MSDNKISSISSASNKLYEKEDSRKQKVHVIHKSNKFQSTFAFQAMSDPQSSQALIKLIKNLTQNFKNKSKQSARNIDQPKNNTTTNNVTSQLDLQKNAAKTKMTFKDNIADYTLSISRSSHRKSNEQSAEETKKSFIFTSKRTLQNIITNDIESFKFRDVTISTKSLSTFISAQIEKQAKLSTAQHSYTSDQFDLAADSASSPNEKRLSPFNATTSSISQEALNENKTLWVKNKTEDYSYTLQRSCQCVSYHNLAVVMTIKGGSIVNACFDDSNKTLTEKHSANKLSINDLFDLIQHEIDKSHQIDVVYSKENGMPISISLFHDKLAKDGLSTITSSNLQKNQRYSIM